jgi:hypothetical protein
MIAASKSPRDHQSGRGLHCPAKINVNASKRNRKLRLGWSFRPRSSQWSETGQNANVVKLSFGDRVGTCEGRGSSACGANHGVPPQARWQARSQTSVGWSKIVLLYRKVEKPTLGRSMSMKRRLRPFPRPSHSATSHRYAGRPWYPYQGFAAWGSGGEAGGWLSHWRGSMGWKMWLICVVYYSRLARIG